MAHPFVIDHQIQFNDDRMEFLVYISDGQEFRCNQIEFILDANPIIHLMLRDARGGTANAMVCAASTEMLLSQVRAIFYDPAFSLPFVDPMEMQHLPILKQVELHQSFLLSLRTQHFTPRVRLEYHDASPEQAAELPRIFPQFCWDEPTEDVGASVERFDDGSIVANFRGITWRVDEALFYIDIVYLKRFGMPNYLYILPRQHPQTELERNNLRRHLGRMRFVPGEGYETEDGRVRISVP